MWERKFQKEKNLFCNMQNLHISNIDRYSIVFYKIFDLNSEDATNWIQIVRGVERISLKKFIKICKWNDTLCINYKL